MTNLCSRFSFRAISISPLIFAPTDGRVGSRRRSDRASNDADVSSILPIISYCGFSPVRLDMVLQARSPARGYPFSPSAMPFIGWSGAAGKLSRISKSNLRQRDFPDAKYLYELGIEDPRLVVSESQEARRSQALEQSSELESRGRVSTWHPCLRQFEIWQLPSASGRGPNGVHQRRGALVP
jgi:hypothetical protein